MFLKIKIRFLSVSFRARHNLAPPHVHSLSSRFSSSYTIIQHAEELELLETKRTLSSLQVLLQNARASLLCLADADSLTKTQSFSLLGDSFPTPRSGRSAVSHPPWLPSLGLSPAQLTTHCVMVSVTYCSLCSRGSRPCRRHLQLSRGHNHFGT